MEPADRHGQKGCDISGRAAARHCTRRVPVAEGQRVHQATGSRRHAATVGSDQSPGVLRGTMVVALRFGLASDRHRVEEKQSQTQSQRGQLFRYARQFHATKWQVHGTLRDIQPRAAAGQSSLTRKRSLVQSQYRPPKSVQVSWLAMALWAIAPGAATANDRVTRSLPGAGRDAQPAEPTGLGRRGMGRPEAAFRRSRCRW
jgi:hypothetical protein